MRRLSVNCFRLIICLSQFKGTRFRFIKSTFYQEIQKMRAIIKLRFLIEKNPIVIERICSKTSIIWSSIHCQGWSRSFLHSLRARWLPMDKTSNDNFKGGNCVTKRSKVLFETSGLGQAPSKDFYFLSVVTNSIVWRSWRITLRNDTSLPSETVQPWRTFVDSSEGKRLQEEVKRVFGVDTLNYILALVTRSWMLFLRSDVLIEIVVHLDLRDIVELSQVK